MGIFHLSSFRTKNKGWPFQCTVLLGCKPIGSRHGCKKKKKGRERERNRRRNLLNILFYVTIISVISVACTVIWIKALWDSVAELHWPHRILWKTTESAHRILEKGLPGLFQWRNILKGLPDLFQRRNIVKVVLVIVCFGFQWPPLSMGSTENLRSKQVLCVYAGSQKSVLNRTLKRSFVKIREEPCSTGFPVESLYSREPEGSTAMVPTADVNSKNTGFHWN